MADDADPCDFVVKLDRRARKEHKCSECRRTIRPREIYEHVTLKFDGAFHRVKVCRHCRVARDWLIIVCDGWLYEGILEDLEEHQGEGHNFDPWLRAYIEGMKRKWHWPDGRLMALPSPCPDWEVLERFAKQWVPKDEDDTRRQVWVP